MQVDKIIYLLAFKISNYIYLSKDSRFLKKMSLDSYDADIMYTLQLFEILFWLLICTHTVTIISTETKKYYM